MQNLLGPEGPVADDLWLLCSKELSLADLPEGDIIVPLALWLASGETLLARAGRKGVLIGSDEQVESLEGRLGGLALVALDFPVFSDGRSYSNARVLRERLAYRGELRAVGDVLRDQIFLMRRCGFDSFALRPDRPASGARSALHDFRHVYQQATMDPDTPLLARHD
jgi:uncharacterized protein (DUF934 family)